LLQVSAFFHLLFRFFFHMVFRLQEHSVKTFHLKKYT